MLQVASYKINQPETSKLKPVTKSKSYETINNP
jgi:hypothetical protein